MTKNTERFLTVWYAIRIGFVPIALAINLYMTYNLQQTLTEIRNNQTTKVFKQHQQITDDVVAAIKEHCK